MYLNEYGIGGLIVMKCKHVDDVPKSNGTGGWVDRVHCDDEAEAGERYCRFHKLFHLHQDDLEYDWLKQLHD